MRFYFILWALCLQLFCLAQTETTVPVSPEASKPSEESPMKSAIIGYLSYDGALAVIPQRAIVEKQIKELTDQYEAELKRVEDEFNQKYEAFLDGRKDFPRTILLKRQKELQQLLQRNLEFKDKSLQELQQARDEAYAPLRQQLNEAITAIAKRHQLAIVFNTDANACPFIDPDMAIDISEEVKQALNVGD